MVSGGSGRRLDHSNHVQHRLQDGGAPHRSHDNDDVNDDGDDDDDNDDDDKQEALKMIVLIIPTFQVLLQKGWSPSCPH